eukprot:9469715-Pyramimonas_sp.AAC.1
MGKIVYDILVEQLARARLYVGVQFYDICCVRVHVPESIQTCILEAFDEVMARFVRGCLARGFSETRATVSWRIQRVLVDVER